MTTRKRNSPGIEINEIDRSQYNNKPDYSTVGTTTFICGFADKGTNYKTEWINSIKTLQDTYGVPTNEVERYFYNSAIELLNSGGVLLASKLPYYNKSKDNFAYTMYTVDTNNLVNASNIAANDDIKKFYLNELSTADNSLTSYINIVDNSNSSQLSSLLSLDKLDKYKTHEAVIPINKILIVDITQKQYDNIDMVSAEIQAETNNFITNTVNEEFVGIMPVVVSPVNAMYFQQIIQDRTEVDTDIESSLSGIEHSDKISAFNVISDASNRQVLNSINNDEAEYHKLSEYMSNEVEETNFELMLSSISINDTTASKLAASYFPNINYTNQNLLNKKYLKQIGIVVFQVFKDVANNKKLNFSPVEAFIGSLDKNEKDATTHQSIYIDDIVNNNSNYINVFSNIRMSQAYKDASTLLIQNQTAKILGYLKTECNKNIDYVESIINPLTRIFDANQDPNLTTIDIVCDAGVSNIAQFVRNYGSAKLDENYINYNADVYPNIWSASQNNVNDTQLWKLTDGTSAWKTVLQKYDDFCKNTRKDCIFLADVLRPFCLAGNEKIVRSTNLRNTIENSIIPNLKYIIALNSSYSAGYCDWMYVQDYYSKDFFWLPPSIKAAGVCNYIDTYFHPWDAPAGIIRGHLNNVYDIAFSPRNDEAGKIYQNAWNYAINYPIDGIVLEGQKTFQLEQTALDRINVRRLMLYLEKRVRIIAKRFVYEGNTPYLRQQFVDAIQPIFEDAKNSYGLNDYAIRCDDTNNTPETIDHNEFRCAIAIKPVKAIEWIICDFIVTNQSANVREEVMKT